jgi:hypothetical protein
VLEFVIHSSTFFFDKCSTMLTECGSLFMKCTVNQVRKACIASSTQLVAVAFILLGVYPPQEYGNAGVSFSNGWFMADDAGSWRSSDAEMTVVLFNHIVDIVFLMLQLHC